MKLILSFYLLFILNQGVFGQEHSFFERVLNNFSRQSSFISFEVESKNYSGKVLMENRRLFYFFHKTEGFDVEKYKLFMKKLLLNKTKLKVSDKTLEEWQFVKTEDVKIVNDYAAKGHEEFLHYFFQDNVLKKDVDVTTQNAIVSKLFEWQMLVYIDDDSGYLMLLSEK
jgi:hypothetical protein